MPNSAGLSVWGRQAERGQVQAAPPWYKFSMPSFRVETPQRCYSAVVERGLIASTAQYPPPKAGKLFVVSTEDVWRHQGGRLASALAGIPHELLFLPGREEQKRLAPLEPLASQMVELGADRTSVVVAYGGGIEIGRAHV